MPRKQRVNNGQSWKSSCMEMCVSLLKAFSYVKKTDIYGRPMLSVAVNSKEKSPGVSDSA